MYALVIDDSRAMRRIIGRTMQSLGFEPLYAGNGQEGLEQLSANSEDVEVVLVDWNMPVMNGLEFVQAVRATECYQNQKLVMVTTETEPIRMARAMMAGVDEFVMKPFTTEILVEKLKLVGVKVGQQPANQ